MITMTDQERALVACWAWASWSDVARSLATGKVQKPEFVGGSIPDEHRAALPEASFWEARGRAILAGLIPPPGPWTWRSTTKMPFRYECSWSTVQRWLNSWPRDARDDMAELYAAFYQLYLHRADEDPSRVWTREEWDVRDARYNARMESGDAALMTGLNTLIHELIDRQLPTASAEDDWALFPAEAAS